MARASAVMALSWLMTRLCSSTSMRSSFCCSSSLIEVTVTPVQRDTTSSMSSRVTMPVVESSSFRRSRNCAQIFLFLALFLGIEARLLEFVIGDGRFHAVRDEFHALLHFGNFIGQRGLAQLHARAGFVDQIDGLVRQEAVRNVAAREIDGVLDGFVGVADGVKFFVALAHALQNADGFFLGRRVDFHGLEAAFERAIFFDGLAVFAGRGRADALDFAAARAPASECWRRRASLPPNPRRPACATRR